jgi:hypothetical protein
LTVKNFTNRLILFEQQTSLGKLYKTHRGSARLSRVGYIRQILQLVAGATSQKANAADLTQKKMRSLRGVLQSFP